jgi:magnesium-transporting ATPase (P-type)
VNNSTTQAWVQRRLGLTSTSPGAGTLTQNEMVVVRMWLAGQEFDNLQYLTSSGISSSIDGRDPLDLDPRLHTLLINSLALNTTASVEATPGKSGVCIWEATMSCIML